MLVSAILYVAVCTVSRPCETETYAKFGGGQSGAMICEKLAENFNTVGGDEPGTTTTFWCKRQREGVRG